MLVIPVVLLILSGGLIRRIYSEDKKEPVLPVLFLTTLYEKMSSEPDIFLERDFLKELDTLSGYKGKTNIYVEKNNHRVNFIENSHGGKHKDRNGQFNPFSSWDFYFSDGSYGTLTIVIFDALVMKEMFISGGVTLLISIGALILTNGLLSYFVARSIINPLKILEQSALNIKNEDLDTPVVYTGKDEFLDVCVVFEEMRIRLKDSLLEQLKYEENRKELLSNISHDLKTPITAIKGYIEGIQDGIADSPEKMEKYINTVYSKTILMNDLIDRLFLFSKLDLNKIQFNFRKIDLGDFLADMCEELQFDYEKLQLQFQSPQIPLFVSADSMHLHRVVINVIDNAVKYSGRETAEVSIALKDLGTLLEVSIKDRGIGISSESLPHIFERFYRSDPARSSQSEGSGLGLSISNQIVQAHGGEMKAESSPGKGTTIRFTLRKSL